MIDNSIDTEVVKIDNRVNTYVFKILSRPTDMRLYHLIYVWFTCLKKGEELVKTLGDICRATGQDPTRGNKTSVAKGLKTLRNFNLIDYKYTEERDDSGNILNIVLKPFPKNLQARFLKP